MASKLFNIIIKFGHVMKEYGVDNPVFFLSKEASEVLIKQTDIPLCFKSCPNDIPEKFRDIVGLLGVLDGVALVLAYPTFEKKDGSQ